VCLNILLSKFSTLFQNFNCNHSKKLSRISTIIKLSFLKKSFDAYIIVTVQLFNINCFVYSHFSLKIRENTSRSKESDTRDLDHNKLSQPTWSSQLFVVICFRDTVDGEFVVPFYIIFHTWSNSESALYLM
jgi:hypothetical protein